MSTVLECAEIFSEKRSTQRLLNRNILDLAANDELVCMNSSFDSAVAQKLIAPHIARLRRLEYSQLCEKVFRGDIETGEVLAADGTVYQWEFLFYWDDKPDEDVRVIASVFHDPRGPNIDEGFILAPDGHFVDEANVN
jgi:hypothetical protein